MDSCATCSAGYQCPVIDAVNNEAAEEKKICGQNYYCPANTNTRVACPTGYYTTLLTASEVKDCLPCPSGLICQCTAASAATDTCVAEFVKCTAGKFCPALSSSSADE